MKNKPYFMVLIHATVACDKHLQKVKKRAWGQVYARITYLIVQNNKKKKQRSVNRVLQNVIPVCVLYFRKETYYNTNCIFKSL